MNRKGAKIAMQPIRTKCALNLPSRTLRLCGSILFILITGCATEHIPTYPPMPPAQAMKVLADRAHAIHTVSAQGLITLTRDNGDTVRLDAAVVLQPPQRARLRAWKFGQAVFDMTLTPEGLWLIAPRQDSHTREIRAAGANTGKLMRQWLHLITGAFDDPGTVPREEGNRLILIHAEPDGMTMTCEVDRKTLTPRRYTLKDPKGATRFALVLSRYIEISGTVWPRRIEASSDSGRIRIDLRDVEINGELPPAAFRPPARAEKIPEKFPATNPEKSQ
jgi:outer membrane lipoprotein-sorting protein